MGSTLVTSTSSSSAASAPKNQGKKELKTTRKRTNYLEFVLTLCSHKLMLCFNIRKS